MPEQPPLRESPRAALISTIVVTGTVAALCITLDVRLPGNDPLAARVAQVAEEAKGYEWIPTPLDGEWTIETCEAEVRYLLNELDDCYDGPVYKCCCEDKQ